MHLKAVRKMSPGEPSWVENMRGASGLEELKSLAHTSDEKARKGALRREKGQLGKLAPGTCRRAGTAIGDRRGRARKGEGESKNKEKGRDKGRGKGAGRDQRKEDKDK